MSSEQTGLITLGEIALDSLKVSYLLVGLPPLTVFLVALDARSGGKGTGDRAVEEEVDGVFGADR